MRDPFPPLAPKGAHIPPTCFGMVGRCNGCDADCIQELAREARRFEVFVCGIGVLTIAVVMLGLVF